MAAQPPRNLDGLLVFATVAEAGGFTAAADRLGMSKAAVSLAIRRLESRLGRSLFHRTTRQVRLTDEGRSLYEAAAPALAQLRLIVDQAGRDDARLAGILRLTAPADHVSQTLAPAVAAFAARHPDLQVDLRTSDRVVDLVAEGIDLAIRFGHLRDSSLRALRLGDFEQWLVASPAYLDRAGRPDRPEDLAGHQWIALELLRSPLTWTFRSAGGLVRRVRTRARIAVDSAAALRALLIHGAGLSVLDHLSTAAAIREGRLVRVLEGWSLPRGGIYAVLPPGRHVSPVVRAFLEFYRQAVRHRD